MIVLLRIVLRLLADVAGLIALSVRPRRAIEAENLVLRRQLALFKERGMKPRRIDAATRASLAWLSRWCDWRSCLVVVRPETVLRWHRAGWRLFWRCKSQTGPSADSTRTAATHTAHGHRESAVGRGADCQ